MSEMDHSREPHLDQKAQAGELACASCQGEIYDAYFEVNGEASCQKCRYTVEDQRVNGSGAGRFFRASLAGSVAAVLGAGVYYAVLALTEYEFALVSILVGLMVGFAVNWGSGHRGGWLYQTLAVGLTYMAIVSTYVPFILDGWEDEIAAEGISIEEGDGITAPASEAAVVQTEPVQLSVGEVFVGVAAFVLLVAAIPFFAGVENILGLLIIGFGSLRSMETEPVPTSDYRGALSGGAASQQRRRTVLAGAVFVARCLKVSVPFQPALVET